MSLTPYERKSLSPWRPTELGRHLSFHVRRMYHYIKDVAPVLVKYQVRQAGRTGIDNIPFITSDAKRDLKRWIGDYDPKHFEGTFHNIWVEFDVYQNGDKGMQIHSKFNTKGLKNLSCQAAIYFYYQNGTKLRDCNGKYNSYDGQISVGYDFTPNYQDTDFNDFKMFMPYSELHMGRGHHDLKFKIDLYAKKSGVFFASSWYYNFFYNS